MLLARGLRTVKSQATAYDDDHTLDIDAIMVMFSSFVPVDQTLGI